MKKILSLILAGLMTVSCAAFVAADDAATEPAADNGQTLVLEFLHAKGIWKGVDEGEFVADAESDVQRYQMALLVSRISTGWLDDAQWMDDTANDSTFDDIEEGVAAKYLGALSYANQNGIIEGVSATKFDPYGQITYRDALTMVVRTMGYKGLAYPWGYIEKAVELGLTEDVNVPYTQALKRGEVAQILYAALFAPTKSGETLANSIFDFDFGWETIVITSTDEGTFEGAAKETTSKYVGFNLIDEDGNIGTKTYYTDKKELGLDNGHDDELALGYIYDVLFSIDDDLAVIEKAYKHEFVKYANDGITTNEAVAVTTQPIKAYADKYSLVSERHDKEYLTFLSDELFVYEQGVVEYFVDTTDKIVGIKNDTWDIVRLDEATGEWKTAWFYNKTLQKYYRINPTDGFTAGATDKADGYWIDWMTDAEFAEWYALYSKKIEKKDQYTLKTTFSGALDAPYARLYAFNLDKDVADEMALYKTYSLGYFENSTVACGDKTSSADHSNKDVKYKSYKVSSMDGEVFNKLVEADHVADHESLTDAFVWFNVEEGVTGFDNGDGTYNNGAIVYNHNAATGEINVIKYIPTTGVGMDKDSYYVSGILNGYSTDKNNVIIDGVKIPYGYDKLSGVASKLYVGDNSIAQRYYTAAYLDGLLMQYVSGLVVDGKLVDIDVVGQGNNNSLIVVYDYAGITSDGYIAVYGVDAKDGAMKVFKINSFNGWKKGDYRYYPENADDDKAFDLGTLYFVKSYDSATQSYGVETFNIDEYSVDEDKLISIDYEGGYRIVTDAEGNKTVEDAKDSDLYVVITTNGRVYTTTGKQTDKYGKDMYKIVEGYQLFHDGGKFVIYADDDDVFEGFKLNGAGVGLYLYDRDASTVLDAWYDDAEGVEDYYLLGATVSNIRAYNILTGNWDSLILTENVDLDTDTVYITIGNIVVDKWNYNGTDGEDLVDRVADDYAEDDMAYADYIALAKEYEFTSKGIDLVAVAKDLKAITNETNADVQAKIAAKVIDKVIYKNVIDVENKKGETVGIDIDDIELKADKVYVADAVYNVADKDLIVYIYDELTETFTDKVITNDGKDTNDKPLDYGEAAVDNKNENYVGLDEVYFVTAKFDNTECKGELESLALNTLTLTYTERVKGTDGKFTSKALESKECELHNLIAGSGNGFGVDFVADKNYTVAVKLNGKLLDADLFDYTVEGLTCCGLGYKVVVTFKDGVALKTDAVNEVQVGVRDAHNNFVKTSINLEAEYLTSGTEVVFDGIAAAIDWANVKVEGTIDLNKDYEELAKNY